MVLSKNEEKIIEQVTFEELEFESEALTEEEIEELTEEKTYYTISGKEQQYEPEWEKYTIKDLEVGNTCEGRPEIVIFENDEKTYNALRLRVMDDGEILDLYLNFPKKQYPYVEKINKYFDFYRTCFDFIFSILKHRGEEYVVNEKGDEVDQFNKVNLELFAKYVDQHERVGVKVTEGNPDSDYNSWIIYKME